MKQEEERSEIRRLQKEIHYHNYRYHVLEDPIISDYEYDMMIKRLRELEETHPDLVTPDSPTRRIGSSPMEKFIKVSHPAPILSLANAFNKNDLIAWFDRIKKLDPRVANSGFVLEPKIDGLTVVLHYENGIFSKGATRGDGDIGEDITANLITIRSLPLNIPIVEGVIDIPEHLVVRGEVYINLADFDRLNESLSQKGEKTYQNPRNTSSGSLRQLDPAVTRERPLNLLTYAIVECSDGFPPTQWETLEFLKQAGFPVSPLSEKVPTIKDVLERVDGWMTNRDNIPFEVDGVVIKLDDLVAARVLGVAGKDPRGAIALKYPAREISTTLLDIGVNVGRTGVLTPYAILEPVELGGVIIKQATLHNFDFIQEKDIRINDRVLIKRAGDVIPYVIGPLTGTRKGDEKAFKIPEICPSCGQKVENLPGEVAFYCVNTSCPAQLIRNIEHFVSRQAMDIEGMGIKIVEQLVESGFIKDLADLYLLKAQDLLTLEGFADKKTENLLEAIKNTRGRSLARFINSLGIHGVGEVTSQDLARNFLNLDNINNASLEELTSISGIGPNIALGIKDWFERPANQLLLEKFKRLGIWPQDQAKKTSFSEGILSDKVFVITGTLPTLSRDEAKKLIEEHGGKTTDSISRNTSYLLLGENPGSKLEKAITLGVLVIGETELLEMIGSRS
ncbi:MAG TPA: NAD-dependent DNA ligase LigA [Anaerolineaceae bacterium]|nr:NAD-dependent DNA ligase LigA [Anaerolineaceae bacterium]